MLNGKKWTDYVPSGNPKGKDVTTSVTSDKTLELSSELGLSGTISEVSEPQDSKGKAAGSVKHTGSSITFTPPTTGDSIVRFNYFVSNGGKTARQRVTVKVSFKLAAPALEAKEVSRKNPTRFRLSTDLKVVNPMGARPLFGLELEAKAKHGKLKVVEASDDEVQLGKQDTLIYTPTEAMANTTTLDTITYTVTSSNGSVTQHLPLIVTNLAPTINTNDKFAGKKYSMGQFPNTESVAVSVKSFQGSDPDGDEISFKAYSVPSVFPGTLTPNPDKPDELIYTPEKGQTGFVTILAVVTDGERDSPVGRIWLELTGSGSEINSDASFDAGTIPGYVPPVPVLPAKRPAFAPSSALTVFDIRGSRMGSSLQGLKPGVYIVRQGSVSRMVTVK
jgi:hypothetical protein